MIESRYVHVDDAEFIALARNAFDVMMRRGWSAIRDCRGKWFVENERCEAVHKKGGLVVRLKDPFAALVEADKWYSENVEDGRTA